MVVSLKTNNTLAPLVWKHGAAMSSCGRLFRGWPSGESRSNLRSPVPNLRAASQCRCPLDNAKGQATVVLVLPFQPEGIPALRITWECG